MTNTILEERVETEIKKQTDSQKNQISFKRAERFARKLGVDLIKLNLPNYKDDSYDKHYWTSYLRWFENLQIRKINSGKKVLSGVYRVISYTPTYENKVIEHGPESTFFVVEIT